MKKTLFLFAISCMLSMHFTSSSQSIIDTLHNNAKVAYIEAAAFGSSDSTLPFWLKSNQYGIVPTDKFSGSLRLGIYQNRKKSKFEFGYGLNVVGNVSKKASILLPEAFVKLKYGWFDFYAGRKRETFGLADKILSSGSYIWSGNALPLPKIQISWNDYKPLWENGWIALKGNFAHGWFGDQKFIKNYYLHQKTLYGRIGRETSVIKLHGGFNHQVQWGGTPKVNIYAGNIKGQKYPSDLNAYILSVTGQSLGTLAKKNKIDTTIYSANDANNRVGNHLGSLDVAMEIDLKKVNVYIYRQQIYEDGKLYHSEKLSDLVDGLTGLSFTIKDNSIIKKVIFEQFYSAYQGADLLKINPGYGYNNYFSQGQYLDGWTYQGKTIGTPSITQSVNNRISMIYAGISGNYHGTNFILKSSYTKNLGVYGTPRLDKVLSNYLYLDHSLKNNSRLMIALNLDAGYLTQTNFGLNISYRKIIF